jgi:hypothetical protein
MVEWLERLLEIRLDPPATPKRPRLDQKIAAENQLEAHKKYVEIVSDGIIDTLARLGRVPGDRYRQQAARQLGIRLPTLDLEVMNRRNKIAGDTEVLEAEVVENDDTELHLRKKEVGDYFVRRGRLYHKKELQGGVVPIPLTNFDAEIIEEITIDDGVEERREVLIAGRTPNGRLLTPVRMPVPRFAAMSWPTERWGNAAIVRAGLGTKDHVRAAIQMLSENSVERSIYAHTGWRRIGDRWFFLHGGGAIGQDGAADAITVEVTEKLGRLVLALPNDDDELRRAIRASLTCLDVAPLGVTAALLGAAYLAPLREALRSVPPDLVVYLRGPTGAFKSELTALAQAHFGDFTRDTLPLNYSATVTSIEGTPFAAKDALIVVDDFHPPASRAEAAAMEATINRLFRAVGNQTSRSRSQANLQLRPDRPPRGVVMSSGERLPGIVSSLARAYVVELKAGDVKLDLLTRLQKARSLFAIATGGYVRWLAPQLNALANDLPARFEALRTELQGVAFHARQPGQLAHLLVGLELFSRFAVEMGAIDREESERRLAACRAAMLSATATRSTALSDETPITLFLRLLSDGFGSRRIYVEPTGNSGRPPENAGEWGWEPVLQRDQNGEERVEVRRPPGGRAIGLLDDQHVYLLADELQAFLKGAAARSGTEFPIDGRSLREELANAGLIKTETEQHQGGVVRRTSVKPPGGPERRYVALRRTSRDGTSLTGVGLVGLLGSGEDSGPLNPTDPTKVE